MVDALDAVRKRLRSRGILVDIQPDLTYQPALSVRGRSRRVFVGAVTRAVDENILAAHVARDRVLADGRFRLVGRGDVTFRARHDFPSFERELANNANWSLPRGFRARLTAARHVAGASSWIELEKRSTTPCSGETEALPPTFWSRRTRAADRESDELLRVPLDAGRQIYSHHPAQDDGRASFLAISRFSITA